jgi:hypothetical protein
MNILSHEIHLVVGQPLPCPRLSQEKLVFKLADFGHGENIRQFTRRIFAYNYFQLNGSRTKSQTRSPL